MIKVPIIQEIKQIWYHVKQHKNKLNNLHKINYKLKTSWLPKIVNYQNKVIWIMETLLFQTSLSLKQENN